MGWQTEQVAAAAALTEAISPSVAPTQRFTRNRNRNQHRITHNAKRAPTAPILLSSELNQPQPPSLLLSELITATGAAAVAGMPRGSTADT